MKSRITIEVDFDTAKPYIKVVNDKQSDDVRDKLITHFRQMLGHTSSWCRVRFDDTGISTNYNGSILFTIEPITPLDLKSESEMMTEQVRLNIEHKQTASISH